MGRLLTAKHYVAATVLLPIGAVLLWPANLWLTILLLVWLIAAALYWIRSERKEYEDRMTRTIAAMQCSAIRTLNHHRHDWMNDLQVLFGYTRLQRLDKTIDYMEKIRERMAMESNIAKLGNPSLISFIQSFRTMTNSLLLEVEVIGPIRLDEMSVDGDKIAESIIHTINAYRFAVKHGGGDPSVLRLELSADDNALYAAFYYKGELINEQQWKQKIQQQLEGALLQPIHFEQPFTKVLLKAEMRA